MSRQIAVRLPDDVVAFVDSVVAGGRARSRAEVVLRALAREQRLAAAEQDLVVLLAESRHRVHDDLDDVVAWTSANPIDADAD